MAISSAAAHAHAHAHTQAHAESPRITRYPARALGVAAAWAVGAAPAIFGLTRCPSAVFLHAACPGCGMTRAMRALLSGHVEGSLHQHALAVPLVVASALVMLATTATTFRLGTPIDLLREPYGRLAAKIFVATQALLLLYYVARLAGAFGGLPPV